jgi:hypothetical protein
MTEPDPAQPVNVFPNGLKRAVVAQQIFRFQLLRKFPDSRAAIEELVDCLGLHSENHAHMAAAVDRLVRTREFVPRPHELIQALESVTPVEVAPKDQHCRACTGTGWEPVWTLTTYTSTGDAGAGTGFCHRKTEIIHGDGERTAAEVAKGLKKQMAAFGVDPWAQRIDEAVRRCTCCGYGRSLAEAETTQAAIRQARREKRSGGGGALVVISQPEEPAARDWHDDDD